MGSDRFDVIIVGGGGAGLTASLEAARLGLKVMLIEKNNRLGGTTGISIGSVTAGGTSLQRRAGIRDDPDQYFQDFDRFERPEGATDNLELRRLLTENAADTVEWLLSLGLSFAGPMPELPHRHPRMHNILPNIQAFIYRLSRECRRHGVTIWTRSRVEELLTDEKGVIGVKVRDKKGLSFSLFSNRGVILTTGDYSAGEDLREKYLPSEMAGLEAINPTSTGDGHRLALAVGAGILNSHLTSGPQIRFIPPKWESIIRKIPPFKIVGRFFRAGFEILPGWLLRPFIVMYMTIAMEPSVRLFQEGAVLVNRRGLRFVDELKAPAFALAKQPGNTAYVVFDDRMARKFSGWPYFISTAPGIAYAYLSDYRRYRRDIFHSSRTLEGLARSIDIPQENLIQTISRYNSETSRRSAIEIPPYFALGPAKSWIMTTDGSLTVTANLEVINESGEPIPGLYAAGSVGQGGLLIPGHGQHLGWAFTSGRLAARSVAKSEPGPLRTRRVKPP